MSKASITEWVREKASPVGTLLVASVIVGSSIGFAARAHAEPETVQSYAFRNATAICAMLANDDSDAGITNVAVRLFNVGVQPYQAGEVMYLAVHNVCPGFEPELLAWAHKVAPPVSQTYQASAKVGGVVGA